ncbi:MAG: hypothetical protein H7A24_15735 [Leptospiraceae bacterium]|nr:hypothetical protein [Leptospiraceae bacterium]MCP5513338.1 hypothetical protein [Leptospiraceae bacterium]
MLLYTLRWTKERLKFPLYFRLKGNADITERSFVLLNGSSVSFDTYFNSFCPLKWSLFTELENVKLSIRARGKGKLTIYVRDRHQIQIERELEFDSIDTVLDIPFPKSESLVYPELEAKDRLEIQKLEYHTESPKHYPDLTLVMNTYRREDFVRSHLVDLKTFIQFHPDLKDKFQMILVDNASTLGGLSESFLSLIPIREGSEGCGFTFGIEKVISQQKSSHVCIMEDDVEFDPFFLERLYSFLALLKPEYHKSIVAGAILRYDSPLIQHEIGKEFRGYYSKSLLKNKNLSFQENVLQNEGFQFPKNGFASWRLVSIPLELFSEFGQIYPMIFHGYDLEFFLRSRAHFLSLNGFSVWHEINDYTREKWFFYYKVINHIILNLIYFPDKKNIFLLFFAYRVLLDLMLKNKKEELFWFRKALEDVFMDIEEFKKRSINDILNLKIDDHSEISYFSEWKYIIGLIYRIIREKSGLRKKFQSILPDLKISPKFTSAK